MIPNLYYLIGFPASGKSTWANEYAEDLDSVWLSSDAIRLTNFKDENDQNHNAEVFKLMELDAVGALRNGKNVIYDSTGLSAKHRIAFLNALNAVDVNKIALLFLVPFDVCMGRNARRERVVPEEAMNRMRKSITIPQYEEGWDEIQIKWDFNARHYSLTSLFDEMDEFDQNNRNHTLTLGAHCKSVANNLVGFLNNKLYIAGLLHDIGKRYTKVEHTMKGVPTEDSHYFGHECVGAYESLFYTLQMVQEEEDALWISGLIQYHMRPYFAKSEKAQNKLRMRVGDKMYSELLKLNAADREAH